MLLQSQKTRSTAMHCSEAAHVIHYLSAFENSQPTCCPTPHFCMFAHVPHHTAAHSPPPPRHLSLYYIFPKFSYLKPFHRPPYRNTLFPFKELNSIRCFCSPLTDSLGTCCTMCKSQAYFLLETISLEHHFLLENSSQLESITATTTFCYLGLPLCTGEVLMGRLLRDCCYYPDR
jgi:hypothetical protein